MMQKSFVVDLVRELRPRVSHLARIRVWTVPGSTRCCQRKATGQQAYGASGFSSNTVQRIVMWQMWIGYLIVVRRSKDSQVEMDGTTSERHYATEV